MLKRLWDAWFEKPVQVGETVLVSANQSGDVRTAPGIVCQLYGDGTAVVCIFRCPNPPEYRRLTVLTRTQARQTNLMNTDAAWRSLL